MSNLLVKKYADLALALAKSNGPIWFMGRSNHMDVAVMCVPSHVISDLRLFGRSAHDQLHILESGEIETRKVVDTVEWQTTVGFSRLKNNIQREIRIRLYTSEGVLIDEKISVI